MSVAFAALVIAQGLTSAPVPVARADILSPPGIHTIIDNPGGVVGLFQMQVAALDRSGRQIRFMGDCASACTMFLELAKKGRACAGPEAQFRFHSARTAVVINGSLQEARLDAEVEEGMNDLLMEYYPPEVQILIKMQGGLPFEGWITIKGTDILPKC